MACLLSPASGSCLERWGTRRDDAVRGALSPVFTLALSAMGITIAFEAVIKALARFTGSRCCPCFLAAAYLTLAVLPALAQETGLGDIPALVCGDQDAADEIMRTLRDSDAEIVVRRLVVMMKTEGCKEVRRMQSYDAEKVEPSGVLEIRLRRTTGYLVPLAPSNH
jgi:hypothetical protein